MLKRMSAPWKPGIGTPASRLAQLLLAVEQGNPAQATKASRGTK